MKPVKPTSIVSEIADNRMVLGSATKMRKKPLHHFDENSANLQVGESVSATRGENLHRWEILVAIKAFPRQPGEHAVVLGAGMAGLLAARVLRGVHDS